MHQSRSLEVLIRFPALDRLIDFLQAAEQKVIDDATKRINDTSDVLQNALEQEK